MVKDPVCGMIVNFKIPPETSDFNGQTYYFCSLGCKEDFDRDPAHYLSGSESRENTAGTDSHVPNQSEW